MARIVPNYSAFRKRKPDRRHDDLYGVGRGCGVGRCRGVALGVLPVCEGQRLVGMMTDRYITIRATAYGHDPNTAPVRNYMSSDLICCFEDQDIKEAEQLMRQTRVRRLPVLTREKQVAGMVALDDLASRAEGVG